MYCSFKDVKLLHVYIMIHVEDCSGYDGGKMNALLRLTCCYFKQLPGIPLCVLFVFVTRMFGVSTPAAMLMNLHMDVTHWGSCWWAKIS